ncbi:MAG TPA: AAA family ATPase [Cyanobacteria bacterium UBA8803]|nr:AAA family ATPase [Cyanobacteria bacterium UBA9273]HBL60506.1 AAA family ATPase [Cyanobacteria bacterium UBA8803]
MNDWKIFHGNREPHEAISTLPDAPSWRQFQRQQDVDEEVLEDRWQKILSLVKEDSREYQRGKSFRVLSAPQNSDRVDVDSPSPKAKIYQGYKELIDGVNAAIYLRRPLLVTGRPGSGKTSLAYAIAYELQLGPVLAWSITTRTILKDGLYNYDAIARLQNLQLLKLKQDLGQETPQQLEENIGQYLRLGPVGTAFLPSYRPRILLIDEIDKSDINLPNDLLNLFEEGGYSIPELERLGTECVTVRTADRGIDTEIKAGQVQCNKFPIVVMTSNGERDFPPAFLRRCLRVRMPEPNDIEFLREVVNAHFVKELGAQNWQEARGTIDQLIQDFVQQQQGKEVATDQLLSTIYLFSRQIQPDGTDRESLKQLLLKRLDSVVDQ